MMTNTCGGFGIRGRTGHALDSTYDAKRRTLNGILIFLKQDSANVTTPEPGFIPQFSFVIVLHEHEDHQPHQ